MEIINHDKIIKFNLDDLLDISFPKTSLIRSIARKYHQKNKTPYVVGIRHQIGICGETHWIDDTLDWLSYRIIPGDKVMMEVPEYPFSDLFEKNVSKRVKNYFKPLCKYIESQGGIIIPGEDTNRFGTNDERYSQENVRDNEVFIPKLQNIKPRFFLVGYAHLDYLKEKMPELRYVSLVNEKKDQKHDSWLNVKYYKL